MHFNEFDNFQIEVFCLYGIEDFHVRPRILQYLAKSQIKQRKIDIFLK